MDRMILDFDPLTGTTEYLEFSDEKVRIVQQQDVSPILDVAKTMANDEDYTKQGIKQDHWHYARIPYGILQEMKSKHGADWNDKNDTNHKKFFRVLNREYPSFKTTHWNHE